MKNKRTKESAKSVVEYGRLLIEPERKSRIMLLYLSFAIPLKEKQ